MTMYGWSKASVVIHVVTMAMDGRLKASVVIWSVEAHEGQEVDHIMRRGPNIDTSSVSIAHESQEVDNIMRRGPNIDMSSVSIVYYCTTDGQDWVL